MEFHNVEGVDLLLVSAADQQLDGYVGAVSQHLHTKNLPAFTTLVDEYMANDLGFDYGQPLVVVNTDVVTSYSRMFGDMFEFVIAHEIGHVKCGHLSTLVPGADLIIMNSQHEVDADRYAAARADYSGHARMLQHMLRSWGHAELLRDPMVYKTFTQLMLRLAALEKLSA